MAVEVVAPPPPVSDNDDDGGDEAGNLDTTMTSMTEPRSAPTRGITPVA